MAQGTRTEADPPLLTAATLILAKDPAIVGKVIAPDGQSETIGAYTSQQFMRYDMESLSDVGDLMSMLDAGTGYIIAGIAAADEGLIGTSDGAGALAKSNENFPFRRSPGLMLIDCDVAEIDADTLRKMLDGACSGFDQAGFVWQPSSSSYIYKGGDAVSDLKGSHSAVPVLDTSDIPRAGDVLFKRLWLAGHGYVKISRSGAPLERAPYDRAMLRPMQPMYVGGAYCAEPYKQERGEPVIVDGEFGLDTRKVIRDLTQTEESLFRQLVIEAKKAIADEANEIRRKHREGKAARQARRALGSGASPSELADMAATLESGDGDVDPDGGWLPLTHIIELQGNATVTVAEVLAGQRKYHRRICRDPIGGYMSGILYLDGGVPVLHSEASAKATWSLGSEAERAALREAQNAAGRLTHAMLSAPQQVRQDFIAKTLMRWEAADALTDDLRNTLELIIGRSLLK